MMTLPMAAAAAPCPTFSPETNEMACRSVRLNDKCREVVRILCMTLTRIVNRNENVNGETFRIKKEGEEGDVAEVEDSAPTVKTFKDWVVCPCEEPTGMIPPIPNVAVFLVAASIPKMI
mmetsp:Transcript_23960/g.68196  ORF Transcript_23960/g.68196 Transcript_23960/m.68196 type:complete len:119 (+) Transcript_23960:987-1343(+)